MRNFIRRYYRPFLISLIPIFTFGLFLSCSTPPKSQESQVRSEPAKPTVVIKRVQRFESVKEAPQVEPDPGTVSGTTQAPTESPSLFVWFVQLFWPILVLIGAAFLAIGFLFVQTRVIARQLKKRMAS